MTAGVDDLRAFSVERDPERDDLSVAYADVAIEGAGGCNNVSGGDDGVESHCCVSS